MSVPSWVKTIFQPIVDEAVAAATQLLVGKVNSVIDSNHSIPSELKNEIKLLVDGPILALRIKL